MITVTKVIQLYTQTELDATTSMY